MTKPIIRSEVPEDVAAIEAVTASAFLEAPHTDHNEQFILAALRDAGALTVSLVAEMDGAIVGNVAVSPVSLSGGTAGWFGIGPVSVIPGLQGRGIGSQLMREALARLSGQGASGCVVLGDPSYYQRFGFTSQASLVLPDVPSEYFMALSFGPAMPTGTVTYHPAFGMAKLKPGGSA
ncbi:MAG: GNAT family N-acetyltransferase [Noviherbaspirillum sp.]